MSMFNWFDNKKRQLEQLEQQRSQSKQQIRLLRARMEEWVERAVDADDLDQRICAMEYRGVREEMNAEMEHFADLSMAIRQMKKSALTEREHHALDQVTAAAHRINYDKLMEDDDYVAILRELKREQDQRLTEAHQTLDTGYAAMQDDEFSRLVHARRTGTCAV